MPPEPRLVNAEQLAQCVITALDALKAHDIKCLDVRNKTSITDYMVLATGTSQRHVSALAERVLEAAKSLGEQALGVEGLEHGEWVLVDLSVVIVHVMLAEMRDFYKLENLWEFGETMAAQTSGDEGVAQAQA